MDLTINDIDFESIMENVLDNSFEAVDLDDIDSYCKEPAETTTKGKNMYTLRKCKGPAEPTTKGKNMQILQKYKEPTTKGKNMPRLRNWYQHTVAKEWREYYAQNDCHITNVNADSDSESDDSTSNSSNSHYDENVLPVSPQDTFTEMTCNYIDDDEEIYCFCRNRRNHQAMVACDGAQCKYLWFHFSCVGLPTNWSSEENWLCPECRLKVTFT